MKIQKKIRQYRRDFTAIYVCGHCGATKERDGYDDAYFHNTAIPSMVCESCGKTEGAVTSTPDVPAGVIL